MKLRTKPTVHYNRYTKHYEELFYSAFDQLEKLFDGAKENFSPKGIEQKLDVMEKGKESIIAYKKQVFRHYVSSGTWAKYYQQRKKKSSLCCNGFCNEMVGKSWKRNPA